MNAYEFSGEWTEGAVRDVIGAAVHQDPNVGPMIGARRIEVTLTPGTATFPDEHDVVTTPAYATVIVNDKPLNRAVKANRELIALLDAVAKASGIRPSAHAGADGSEGFGVLWRRASTAQEIDLAQAVRSMREDRERAILANFKARWCAAA